MGSMIGEVGRAIIKMTELKPRDLCIYSSPRKHRLKRSGNFPGHWPSPTWWGRERMKRTAEERWEQETGYECTLLEAMLAVEHPTANLKLTCEHVCTQRKERREKWPNTSCTGSLLFADWLWLMSLKGQTPLKKINGVSEAWGNGLWGPARHIPNMTVITGTEHRWKEPSEAENEHNTSFVWP